MRQVFSCKYSFIYLSIYYKVKSLWYIQWRDTTLFGIRMGHTQQRYLSVSSTNNCAKIYKYSYSWST